MGRDDDEGGSVSRQEEWCKLIGAGDQRIACFLFRSLAIRGASEGPLRMIRAVTGPIPQGGSGVVQGFGGMAGRGWGGLTTLSSSQIARRLNRTPYPTHDPPTGGCESDHGGLLGVRSPALLPSAAAISNPLEEGHGAPSPSLLTLPLSVP